MQRLLVILSLLLLSAAPALAQDAATANQENRAK
jgi:hypothetical protein